MKKLTEILPAGGARAWQQGRVVLSLRIRRPSRHPPPAEPESRKLSHSQKTCVALAILVLFYLGSIGARTDGPSERAAQAELQPDPLQPHLAGVAEDDERSSAFAAGIPPETGGTSANAAVGQQLGGAARGSIAQMAKDKQNKQTKHEAAEATGASAKMNRKEFEKELASLEVELTRLQTWVKDKGTRVIVVFRDGTWWVKAAR